MLQGRDGSFVTKNGQKYIIDWYVPNPIDPKGKPLPWNSDELGVNKTVDVSTNAVEKILNNSGIFLGD